MPRLRPALLALAALPLLLALGATLSACDTAGCDGGGVLQIEDLEIGEGAVVTANDVVVVALTGRLEDGTVFAEIPASDSTALNLSPTAPLNEQVIEGFRTGIVGNDDIEPMRIGGRRLIMIPPELAYGEGGSFDGSVPSCATLTYEVEILDVE